MKIVHAHKYFHSHDGASRYERGLMRLQEHAGHTVVPFAMHDPRNIPTPWQRYFVSNENTQKVSFGLRGVQQIIRAVWSGEAAKKFQALVDDVRPDVIHVHNIYTQISPSILAVAKRQNIPVVMTVHDYALVSANYALWNGTRSMDLRDIGVWATARTRYIKGSFCATLALEMILKAHHAIHAYDGAIHEYITFSDFMRGVLVRAGFERERITVMHPFAEPLIGKHPNEKKKQRKHEQKYILFAGRLEAYKGAHVLLHALDHLPSDISVVLAGVGPDEARLRAMTRNDSRVTFLGFVPGEKLWNLMEDAVVVVVPSLWHEPYGLVALEAMCRGTPVIVTQQGGLPEILGDDACGMVVPSGDSSALGRAVTRLWNNDVLARTMGDAAFVRARQIADPEVHSGHVMKVYETAIEKCAQSR